MKPPKKIKISILTSTFVIAVTFVAILVTWSLLRAEFPVMNSDGLSGGIPSSSDPEPKTPRLIADKNTGTAHTSPLDILKAAESGNAGAQREISELYETCFPYYLNQDKYIDTIRWLFRGGFNTDSQHS